MAQLDINPPPFNQQDTFSGPWKSWFTALYNRLSTAQFQTLTAAGAVDVNSRVVTLSAASSGFAVTLEAPMIPGQFLTLQKTQATNTVTMALTNVKGQPSGTTVNFASNNSVVVLISLYNRLWYIVSYHGVTFT